MGSVTLCVSFPPFVLFPPFLVHTCVLLIASCLLRSLSHPLVFVILVCFVLVSLCLSPCPTFLLSIFGFSLQIPCIIPGVYFAFWVTLFFSLVWKAIRKDQTQNLSKVQTKSKASNLKARVQTRNNMRKHRNRPRETKQKKKWIVQGAHKLYTKGRYR